MECGVSAKTVYMEHLVWLKCVDSQNSFQIEEQSGEIFPRCSLELVWSERTTDMIRGTCGSSEPLPTVDKYLLQEMSKLSRSEIRLDWSASGRRIKSGRRGRGLYKQWYTKLVSSQSALSIRAVGGTKVQRVSEFEGWKCQVEVFREGY
ncbi:hypothetical protein AVEN_143824-1 [Araneus ventricosus]|uniref:Uncharacterized protein n=1 Tax=Araneus ventricosus TaxID=182803 RepID=A0A4Y2P8E6_ARAVE|nr:hypothetical protein AVEN_143824-1 [Araneus ventricosus]